MKELTVTEVAEKCGCTRQCVTNWINDKKLKAEKKPVRIMSEREEWRIKESDLEKFLKSARPRPG